MKLFCFITLIFFCSCGQKEEVTQPLVQDITESVYASGSVKAKNQYQVFSPVNGIIREIHLTEGEAVQKGDRIISLVNDAQKLNIENARIASGFASPSFNQDRLNELKVSISIARAKMENDSLLLQRQQHLWREEIGSRNELEQRELAYRTSSANYQAAVLRYRELQKQVTLSSLQSGKQLEITNTLSNDFIIKASQDGRIYTIMREAGEMVNTLTPVAIIGDTSDFILELNVDEYDIARVIPGQKVFLTMDAYKGRLFEGIVSRIIPIMNESSRSFTIDACFTNKPPHLYPNLTAEGNILISSKKNVLTIPRRFLTNENEVVLKDGTRKKIVTGLKDYQTVEVISGLEKETTIKKPL
jgi:HlyD family secretion protein